MAKFNFEKIWEKFISDRAHRLSTSEKFAAKPVPSVYLNALKKKAERLGVSVDAARRSESRSTDAYPTPNCISPAELTDFINSEELDEITIHHLGECAACCALLEMATPSEEILKVLLEEVRIRVGAHAVNLEADMPQIFEPVP